MELGITDKRDHPPHRRRCTGRKARVATSSRFTSTCSMLKIPERPTTSEAGLTGGGLVHGFIGRWGLGGNVGSQ